MSTEPVACPDCGQPWDPDADPRCPSCGLSVEDLEATAAFIQDLAERHRSQDEHLLGLGEIDAGGG